MTARRRLIESIERHVERGNELMVQNTAAFERNGKAFKRNEKAIEDSQRFFAALLVRHERSHQRVVAALDNLSSESQAHTQAILARLGRLPPAGESR